MRDCGPDGLERRGRPDPRAKRCAEVERLGGTQLLDRENGLAVGEHLQTLRGSSGAHAHVILLAEHFLKHFSARARRRLPKLTAAARKRLVAHAWPGNVRELRNLMERLAYLAPEEQDKIDAPDLAFIMSPDAAAAGPLSLDLPLTEATHAFQIEYIKRHIDRARGNMTAAAEKLGLHRSNLYRKMRQLGLETGE